MSGFNPREMSQCRDADKWARWLQETIEVNKILITREEDFIDFMRPWFANAMMAMHDSIHNNEIKTQNEIIEILKEAVCLEIKSQKDLCEEPNTWLTEALAKIEKLEGK
jgi:hypothetical protein